MQREQLEVTEVAEPGTEVIERDADALCGQIGKRRRSLRRVTEQDLFGHLERQPPRREAGLLDQG